MAEEYVGAVILEWDGKEIECASVSTDINTGKRIVKTMNRAGRANPCVSWGSTRARGSQVTA